MGKHFGTDGIRGLANIELTPELAFKVGQAGALVLKKDRAARFVIAKDGRVSGDMLEAALSAGICSVGGFVYSAGILPSPAVSYLTHINNMDAGIMISASHNKMEDNGIKIFSPLGYKIPDETEDLIESYMDAEFYRPLGRDVGMINVLSGALEDYTGFLKNSVANQRFDGLKIVIDSANGAASNVAHIVFEWLGARVYSINNKPNGTNINDKCGSTHIECLQNYMEKGGFDVGFSLDGDADRCFAVTEKNKVVDGDGIMAMCAEYLSKKGKLKDNTLVSTVMSNQGLEVFCKERSLKMLRADVGDKYVLKEMLDKKYNLGGEQSGHIIFGDHLNTGDGILTALMILSIMAEQNKPLSELVKGLETFPQVLINVVVSNELKNSIGANLTIQSSINEITNELGNNGRILVRPSGTEPLVRVMIEGRNEEKIKTMAQNLAELIKSEA